MFETTQAIVKSSLEAQGYEGLALKKQMFLRFYKNDFSPEQLEKILARIDRWYERQR